MCSVTVLRETERRNLSESLHKNYASNAFVMKTGHVEEYKIEVTPPPNPASPHYLIQPQGEGYRLV